MIIALVYLMLALLLLPVINICGGKLKRGCKIEKPGMFPVSLGDVVQDSPVGAADAVVGIPIAPVVGILIVVGIRLTKVPHKKN